jgi:hypothetical protein
MDPAGRVLGLDFDVVRTVAVHELGAFIGSLPSLPTGGELQLGIFDRDTETLVSGASLILSDASVTRYVTGAALASLPTVIRLPPGRYTMAAWGYSSPLVALDTGGTRNATAMHDTDSCPEPPSRGRFSEFEEPLLRFVGASRSTAGPVASLVYPRMVDAGPEARYAAGTFSFVTSGVPHGWVVATRAYESRTALIGLRAAVQAENTFPPDGSITDEAVLSASTRIVRNTISTRLTIDIPAMNIGASEWYVTIANCTFTEGAQLEIRGSTRSIDHLTTRYPPLRILVEGNTFRSAYILISGVLTNRTMLIVERNTFEGMASVADTDDLQPCIALDGATFSDRSLFVLLGTLSLQLLQWEAARL